MNPEKYDSLKFQGTASKLFPILIVNFFLTILTLGIYYPWAKAKLLQYLYSESEFKGSRFVFHGTGQEMFRGFIKVFLFFIVMFGLMALGPVLFSDSPAFLQVAFLGFYLILILLIPFAIHGMLRYRLSRSSWRGIHFGYRGDLGEFYKLFIKEFFLTIITFGIYGAWMEIALRRYITKNIKFGNLEFEFKGDGGELFWKMLGGFFLCVITLYIYLPWYLVSLMNYGIENTYVKQNGKSYALKSTMSGGDYFVLKIVNGLILVFTLGLGMPFVMIRNIKFHLTNFQISNKLDFDSIAQTEGDYKDATGDDLTDTLDLNIF